MLKIVCFIVAVVCLISLKNGKEARTVFSFRESSKGVELFEGDTPVFFFQKAVTSSDDIFSCNNYIHPLYSLDGDTLTELFPKDHPHHRGIFWAWHQIYADTVAIGDSWIMKNISYDIRSVQTGFNNQFAQLRLEVLWKSSVYKNDQPFVEEQTTITVQKSTELYRLIDFEIHLKPLVSDLLIGGSADEKGYGGFSVRIKLPDDLAFTSESGIVAPQSNQIKAGEWMDFSATFSKKSKVSGLAILSHHGNPNTEVLWIIRQRNSMQNIVFPGRGRFGLEMGRPVVLRYRMVIHKGRAGEIDIPKLQKDFNN